jgi:hypothetical protein
MHLYIIVTQQPTVEFSQTGEVLYCTFLSSRGLYNSNTLPYGSSGILERTASRLIGLGAGARDKAREGLIVQGQSASRFWSPIPSRSKSGMLRHSSSLQAVTGTKKRDVYV